MVKRTLFAIATIAFLAGTSPPFIEECHLGNVVNGLDVKTKGKEIAHWQYENKETVKIG